MKTVPPRIDLIADHLVYVSRDCQPDSSELSQLGLMVDIVFQLTTIRLPVHQSGFGLCSLSNTLSSPYFALTQLDHDTYFAYYSVV